jgi:hypothetical protein
VVRESGRRLEAEAEVAVRVVCRENQNVAQHDVVDAMSPHHHQD